MRNRAKRLIREAFRTKDQPAFPMDLVVIAKTAAAKVAAADVASDFEATLKRMGLSKR